MGRGTDMSSRPLGTRLQTHEARSESDFPVGSGLGVFCKINLGRPGNVGAVMEAALVCATAEDHRAAAIDFN